MWIYFGRVWRKLITETVAFSKLRHLATLAAWWPSFCTRRHYRGFLRTNGSFPGVPFSPIQGAPTGNEHRVGEKGELQSHHLKINMKMEREESPQRMGRHLYAVLRISTCFWLSQLFQGAKIYLKTKSTHKVFHVLFINVPTGSVTERNQRLGKTNLVEN